MTATQTQTESEKGSEKREIGAIIQLAAGAKGIRSCHRSQPCRRGSKLFYCTLASVCVCAAPSYCIVAAYLFWSCFLALPSPSTYFFLSLSLLFSFIPHICPLFRIPTLCEKHPSPSPPLHLFFSPYSLWNLTLTYPGQFSPSLCLCLLLAMLQCSCGNSGIMPVVLWPRIGGQFLGPEGCLSFCLCKLGVLGSVLDWKDEQLEGWRPVGANRGHRGHSHSKPWLPAQRCRVKDDHASGVEKELLFPHGSQRT